MIPRILKGLAVAGITVSVQLAVSYVLPFPFHAINVFVAVPILWLLATESPRTLWMILLLLVLLEPTQTLPFGLWLFSGLGAAAATIWLYSTFVTNRSIFSAAALTGAMILILRIATWVSAALTVKSVTFFSAAHAFAYLAAELITTMTLVAGVYALLSRISTKLKPVRLYEVPW